MTEVCLDLGCEDCWEFLSPALGRKLATVAIDCEGGGGRTVASADPTVGVLSAEDVGVSSIKLFTPNKS